MNDQGILWLFDLIPDSDKQKALAILNALIQHKRLTRIKIQKATGLSYAVAGKWVDALEHKGFIKHQQAGRSKIYGLTKIGIRFIKLKEGL